MRLLKLLLLTLCLGMAMVTFSTFAGGPSSNGIEPIKLQFSSLPRSVTDDPFDGPCPVMDSGDIYYVHTCIRKLGSVNIPVGMVAAFYFETYVEPGALFFYNDAYNVGALSGTLASVSTQPGGPFTPTIYIPITRDFNGYAKSPTFYVKGVSPGEDLLMAISQVTLHDTGDALTINITSGPTATPTPTPIPTPTPTPTPTPPDLEFTDRPMIAPLGSVGASSVQVLNGAPLSTGVIKLSVPHPDIDQLSIAASATGPFVTELELPVQTNSAGNATSQLFYVRGQKALRARLSAEFTFPQTTFVNISSVYVVNVSNLTWETFPGNTSLDENPNIGGGLRVFPEKIRPHDMIRGSERRTVVARAKVFPVQKNVTVYFKAFDVDDPSSDSFPVDMGGSFGSDNRGYSNLLEKSAITNNQGIAEVEFLVSLQPGDNYKVAATCNPDRDSRNTTYLDRIVIERTRLRNANGSALPVGKATDNQILISSDLLTTWRRLHIERDSMGTIPVGANSVQGQIMQVINDGAKTRLLVDIILEKGRFEDGKIFISNGESPNVTNFKVTSNLQSDITIDQVLGQELAGHSFVLYDDDDFNGDDGEDLDGDTGEDIPAPDMSSLQDSDDPTLNRLAIAYVRPTYDLSGEDDDVPFLANVLEPSAVADLFEFDNIGTHESDMFWTIYVLNAYQSMTSEDYDSKLEFLTNHDGPLGRVDGVSDADYNGQGVILYAESMADFARLCAAKKKPVPNCYQPPGVVLHEVAHLFGAEHEDGGIMAKKCTEELSLITIAKIRSARHP